MGGTLAKRSETATRSLPEGPIVDIMRGKYGGGSLKWLNYWSDEHGFPIGGSLSVVKVEKLEMQLQQCEMKLRKKKKVSVQDLEMVESNRECLQKWKTEAEHRERKQMMKQLPCEKNNKKSQFDTSLSTSTHAEHSRSHPVSSLYPQLSAMKLDSDLDACPPRGRQPGGQPESVGAPISTAPPRYRLPNQLPLPDSSTALNSPPHTRQGTTYSLSPQHGHMTGHGDDTEASSTSFIPLKQPEILQLPMVEVSGPEGPIMVHRPWSKEEAQKAAEHLPPVVGNGEKYSKALVDFCKEFSPTVPEIRRLLAIKMTASDFAKIAAACDGNQRRVGMDWDHTDNAAYRDALTRLTDAIKEKFPAKIDMKKVAGCKQQEDEPVSEYLHRLTSVFNDNSGLEQPTQMGEAATVWETHLCKSFLDGLLPSIAAETKKSCILPEEARLDDLRKHAIHAQQQQDERKKSKVAKRDTEMHAAALTMYQAVAHGAYTERGQQSRGREMNATFVAKKDIGPAHARRKELGMRLLRAHRLLTD
ncbi:uncharacterized protein V6R79_005369 [Siganus canaliculatus]